VRIVIAVLSALFAISLSANTDLAIESLTVNKTSVVTGDLVSASMRVTNKGPHLVNDVFVSLGPASSFDRDLVYPPTAPADWSCGSSYDDRYNCRGILAVGESADFKIEIRTPPRGSSYVIEAGVFGSTPDDDYTNNERTATVALTPAAEQAELAMIPPQPQTARPSTWIDVPLRVRNDGPDDARDVAIAFHTNGPDEPISLSGDGWQCTNFDRLSGVCKTSLLAKNAESEVKVRFISNTHNGAVEITALVTAAQHIDQHLYDDQIRVVTIVAAADEWDHLLIPLTATDLRGAEGSIWRTDLAMMIAGSTPVSAYPDNCDFPSVLGECLTAGEAPLQQPFDPRGEFGYTPAVSERLGNGQFVYFYKSDINRVRMNSRVFDSSRTVDTAGGAVPIVAASSFTSTGLSLLDIPVSVNYRYTLRIYEADGVSGTEAKVDVFDEDASAAPLTSSVVTLTNPQPFLRTTVLRFPIFPAYVQIDLSPPAVLYPLRAMRVDVTPVDSTRRIWAFLSITDNASHHVTIVAPR
jgi:hypothetical protein